MTFRMLAPIVAALLLAGAPACSAIPDRPAPEAVAVLNIPATQLEERLPVDLELDDRMGTAQVAKLAAALDTAGAVPVDDYRAGDVAYSAAEQSLVVFLVDGIAEPSDGLVDVGRVMSGMDGLSSCARACTLRLSAPRD
ncbi:cyclophilin-like fold protein [Agromyces sp. NPDC055661]